MASDSEDENSSSPVETSQSTENLRQENEQLRRDLEECTDRLLAHLAKSGCPSEAAIRDAFEDLYAGIDACVDELYLEKGFDTAFQKKYMENSQGTRDSYPLFGLDSWWLNNLTWRTLVSRSRYGPSLIMSLTISNFLKDVIFRQRHSGEHMYPNWLSDDNIAMLEDLQKVMRCEQRRGWLNQSTSG